MRLGAEAVFQVNAKQFAVGFEYHGVVPDDEAHVAVGDLLAEALVRVLVRELALEADLYHKLFKCFTAWPMSEKSGKKKSLASVTCFLL